MKKLIFIKKFLVEKMGTKKIREKLDKKILQ